MPARSRRRGAGAGRVLQPGAWRSPGAQGGVRAQQAALVAWMTTAHVFHNMERRLVDLDEKYIGKVVLLFANPGHCEAACVGVDHKQGDLVLQSCRLGLCGARN